MASDSSLIPPLPDDVALQCIARLPLSHHSHLSLVSKSWRSILRSPLFFSTRSLLNSTQHFLYLNLRIPNSPTSKSNSFLLHLNPPYLSPLPPIPSHSQPPIGSSFAVLGSKLFVLGGSINDIPSSNVHIFDSRFNTWEIGPRMRVGREFAAAGVLNGKIYVLGGCLVDSWTKSTNWAEVFDPVTGLWAPVPCPLQIRDKWMHGTAVIGEKIYAMADRGGVVFGPGTGPEKLLSWSYVSTELDLGWRGRAAVVGGILFCYDYLGSIRGFDVEENVWKELKGVNKDLPNFLCGATMANVGEKLCVVWEAKGEGKLVQVSFAEIEIRNDREGQLWGSVVLSQVILRVPNGSSIIHCLPLSL